MADRRNAELVRRLRTVPGLEVRPGEPLARHTTFRIGGPAEWLVEVPTLRGLRGLLEAVDAAGNESTTGPAAGFTTTDGQPPSWPQGSVLTVDNVTATTAQASWTAAQDNSGSVSYRVYLDGALYGSPATPAFDLTGLSPGTTYSLRIEAVDGSGNVYVAGHAAATKTPIVVKLSRSGIQQWTTELSEVRDNINAWAVHVTSMGTATS